MVHAGASCRRRSASRSEARPKARRRTALDAAAGQHRAPSPGGRRRCRGCRRSGGRPRLPTRRPAATPSGDVSCARPASASGARSGRGTGRADGDRASATAFGLASPRQLTATLTIEISPIFVRPSLLYTPAATAERRRERGQVDAVRNSPCCMAVRPGPVKNVADGDAPQPVRRRRPRPRHRGTAERGRGVGRGAGIAAGCRRRWPGCGAGTRRRNSQACSEHVVALANQRMQPDLVHRAGGADHQPAVGLSVISRMPGRLFRSTTRSGRTKPPRMRIKRSVPPCRRPRGPVASGKQIRWPPGSPSE